METIKIYPVEKGQRLTEVQEKICQDLGVGSWLDLEMSYWSLFPRNEMDKEDLEDSLEYEKALAEGVNKKDHKGFSAVYLDRM